MSTRIRVMLGAAVAVALGAGVFAGVGTAGAAHTAAVPTVTMLFGTAPDYLDPQKSNSTQGEESAWVAYLGLYTYAHKGGAAGGVVIPALATGLPVITNGGKTYTMTLRKNLVYSNGKKVHASDFPYAIERALKLTWSSGSFFTGNIVGAAAYATGKAKGISGIVTNDSTGKITINLLAAFGPFLNVLAYPAAGLVPAGTAMTNLTNNPPPGVGPYMVTNVVPNKSWVGAINPYYAKEAIPGIPQGHVTVMARVESNTATETEDVLNNSADLFDTGDQLIPSLVPQIKSQAASRYRTVPAIQNFYFFLNVKEKPFNSQLVREAVTYALDRRVLSRLDGGNLIPGCYFLPLGLIGHPTRPCPYGNPAAPPNLAKAKALVKQSGDMGAAITVWSEERAPRTQFCTYYAGVLSSLGFKVTIKPIADTLYFPTVGTLKLHPQTGFADWNQDFPNPTDFYTLVIKAGITPTNGVNYGEVVDPKIEQTFSALAPVPPSKLGTVAAKWQALDYYAAQKAYNLVFGYQTWPVFTSTRIDYKSLIIAPSYGWDWTSIKVK